MGVILSVHQALKGIGARTLFKDLSFGLHQGSRVGLVGPNGAGKSTLLKILAGLDRVDSGNVVWANRVHVEYVSQNPEFSPGLTLEDFLFKGSRASLEDPKSAALMWESFARLNMTDFDLSKPFSDLSGGARKKAQIVRAFLNEPQVLLMDEPTNHLDVESIMWLEDFMKARSGLTLLIVSHDRLFLQNVVNEIIELNPQYKEGYIRTSGGYAEYIELQAETVRSQQVQQQRRQNDLRRETAWLRRGAKARQTKQSARINSAMELKEEVEYLRGLNRSREIELDLQTGSRTPKKLIEVENLTIARNGNVLVEGLDLIISRRTRLGLLGRNGGGKSSLIHTLLGDSSPGLEIVSGSVKRFDELKVSYFEQHRSGLEQNKTLLQNVCPDGDYVHVRGQAVFGKSYLDRFNFRRDQHDLKVKELSGGEQNRLLIAKLMTQEAQLMVLDEPTNDLDFQTLESLRVALSEFDGAIILVSHDRAFLDEVCDEILYFPTEEEGHHQLTRFSGFLQWQEWKLSGQALEKKPNPPSTPSNTAGSSSAPSSGGSANSAVVKSGKKLSYKEQREYETIEAVIATKDETLTQLKTKIESPEVVSNPRDLMELSQKIHDLEKEVEELYARWQYLENKVQ